MNYLFCIPSVTLLLFFTIVGSDEPTSWNMEEFRLPQEMWEHIVSYVDISSIASVKQICSTGNAYFHYCTLDPDVVENIDKERCTRMLCHFAHTGQEKNFKHFFEHNHTQERKTSLRLLNWPCDSRIAQLMTAHKTGWYQDARCIRWGRSNWYEIHRDVIAATIICLSTNPNVRIDQFQQTFFSWAISRGDRRIMRQLSVNPYIDVDFEHGRCNVALVAAVGEEIETVKKLVANPGIDPNKKCNNLDRTALMQAVMIDRIERVQLLLDQSNTDPNIKNNGGQTALMMAASRGLVQMTKMLLSHPKTDPNIRNEYGRTALMMATVGHYETAAILIADPNVDINAQDNHGYTALFEAVSEGCEEIVKLLLAHPNISPNVQSKGGYTALMWAARLGYTRITKRLLFHSKTDPNMQDQNGSTALMEAVGQNRRAVVRILLGNSDVSRTIQNKDGNTAFMIANNTGRSDLFICNPNFFYYAYLISAIGVIACFNAR